MPSLRPKSKLLEAHASRIYERLVRESERLDNIKFKKMDTGNFPVLTTDRA